MNREKRDRKRYQECTNRLDRAVHEFEKEMAKSESFINYIDLDIDDLEQLTRGFETVTRCLKLIGKNGKHAKHTAWLQSWEDEQP